MLCIPIGPVNLEIFHTALKKQQPQAISVAIGGALGDAIWAICAFFGVAALLNPRMQGVFCTVTAVITFSLGIFALKDSRFIEQQEEAMVSKIKRKRWAFLKGLSMVLVNPLGVITWMICLQFLKDLKIYIPLELRYELLFFLIVTIGAASYFLLIVFITNKMKHIFNPERTVKITKFLGYLLITLGCYFVFNAVRAFFFNSHLLAIPK
ncbi:MAG: LysE family transporter [bacterium]|nr:LysE family transporter [bacterium]